MGRLRIWGCALLLAASLGAGHAASANWTVYVAGDLGISTSQAKVRGTNSVNGTFNPPLAYSDDDSDSSPLIGGAVGLQSPMDEVTPWSLPYGWRLPRTPVRLELEATGLRAFEFKTSQIQNRSFLTVSNSWSLMTDLWFDVPLAGLDRPITSLFGRNPRWLKRSLAPTSLYLGTGIGMAGLDVETTDNVFDAHQETYNFAWQVGGGFGYALTKFVTLGLGYRYVDQGEQETDLLITGSPTGSFETQQRVHEFRTSLRVNVSEFRTPWH